MSVAATRAGRITAPLALVAVALALYGPTLDAPWVWDDGLAIVQNPNLRALWPLGTALGSPSYAPVTGRPTASLSLALNYALTGLTPFGFRAGNLLIHLLAALALAGAVRRTLELPRQRERFGASALGLGTAAALLWLVHPLVTECVAYVTQRTESLMALFALATLYASARGAAPGASARWSAAAVASCALGMGSKEVMVVAPLLVLAHDASYAAGSPSAALRARPRLYAGLAASWLFLAVAIASGPDYAATKMGFEVGIGPLDYALSQAPVLLHYLRLVFWPHPLALDYGDWAPAELSVALPAGALVLALVACAGVLLLRAPRVGFPLAALFVVLAPTSSLVPVGGEVAAERRMYLPLAGLSALAVCLAHVALARAPRALHVAAFAIPALALAVASRARVAEYGDPIALWESAVSARPLNPRPHLILGNQLERAGRREEALASYERSLALDPGYVMARVNYGALLRLVGRVPEATAMLEQVIAENPRVQFAHHNLGLARLDAGDSARAIAEFRRELERQPTFIPAMLELIWLYAAGPEPALRDAAEAGRLARRARELSAGGDAALLDAHAAALAAGGDFARAIETAERAAELATETRRARIRERIEGYRRGEPFVGRP